MSDAELLKALAEARGWTPGEFAGQLVVRDERGVVRRPHQDITDARPLLVELLREGWMLYEQTKQFVLYDENPPGPSKFIRDPSLERCICLAWLEMWRAKQ